MRRLVLFLILSTIAAMPACADEVTDQLDAARRFYEEGDLKAATTELEFVLQSLRAKAGGALGGAMPEPPAGWTAAASEQQAGGAFMGGSMVTRSYTQSGGKGRIEAQIIANSPMMQGFAAMLANPAVMASQPGMQRVRVGRENAILQWKEASRSGELSLIVGKAMIRLDGKGLDSSTPLVELMKRFDLDKIRQIAG